MLIAKERILFKNHIYLSGDILPEDDAEMVVAWQESGSAELKETKKEKKPAAAKTAAKDKE